MGSRELRVEGDDVYRRPSAVRTELGTWCSADTGVHQVLAYVVGIRGMMGWVPSRLRICCERIAWPKKDACAE